MLLLKNQNTRIVLYKTSLAMSARQQNKFINMSRKNSKRIVKKEYIGVITCSIVIIKYIGNTSMDHKHFISVSISFLTLLTNLRFSCVNFPKTAFIIYSLLA